MCVCHSKKGNIKNLDKLACFSVAVIAVQLFDHIFHFGAMSFVSFCVKLQSFISTFYLLANVCVAKVHGGDFPVVGDLS